MARTRNHSVLSVRSRVEVSVRDWLTATRMVAMGVLFWVVPTVGSAPRLPTSVKFNIWSGPFFGSDTRAVVEQGAEAAAEPSRVRTDYRPRSRATHARVAAIH